MVPLVILPLTRRNTVRRRGSFTASTTFSRLPSTITFVSWPLALLILGVRLKSLNQLSPPTTIYARDQPNQGTAMGLSVWSGIAILVFSLSAHQDTFRYITSLARPPSTATRSTRNLSVGRASSETSAAAEFAEGRRNQWPLATALGVGGCSLTQMGWGLVGYLGIEGGGREGNIFASDKLPRDDPWLFTVRLLVLLAIVVGLEGSLETAYGRMRKALGTASLPLPKSPSDRRKSYRAGGSEEDGGSWDWRTALARILVWFVVAGIAVVVTAGGEEGEGLVSVAEIAGCIGSTLLGFLLPCTFYFCLPKKVPPLSSLTFCRLESTLLHRPLPPSSTPIHLCLRPFGTCVCSRHSSNAQRERSPATAFWQTHLARCVSLWWSFAFRNCGTCERSHRLGHERGLDPTWSAG